MICVSCGFCCRTMSPINGGYCPLLIEKESDTGKIYICSDYENRPKECKNHTFPASICPIGSDALGIKDPQKLKARMSAINDAITPLVQECEF